MSLDLNFNKCEITEKESEMTLAEKILNFIEDNYPTEIGTDWERGCAYVLDEIEKICKVESER